MIIFNQLLQLGRLGNQLFQIAATLNHAESLHTKALFNAWPYKNYFQKQIPDILEVGELPIQAHKNEPYLHLPYHYEPIPKLNDSCLIGFFQSEKYFAENIQTILPYITPDVEIVKNIREKCKNIGIEPPENYIAIHIRRGDYLEKLDFHTNLTETNYYYKAIQQFSGCKFLIFSDDIHWCKLNFTSSEYHFLPENIQLNDIEELIIQSLCSGFIIANSTYSWWAAYWALRAYKRNARVIAPANWFGKKANDLDTKDLYLLEFEIL